MSRSSLGSRVDKLEGYSSQEPILWGVILSAGGGQVLAEGRESELLSLDIQEPGASFSLLYGPIDGHKALVMHTSWQYWLDVSRAWADAETATGPTHPLT